MCVSESHDRSQTPVRLEDRLRSEPDEQARIILYRIAPEALTNVAKHAEAREVEVLLAQRDGGSMVRIADDGVGFQPESARTAPGHMGLAAMRERARLAGGRIRIDSAPGTGTVVECWIPSLTGNPQEKSGTPETQ
jgi:signal transduction histidine kinase